MSAAIHSALRAHDLDGLSVAIRRGDVNALTVEGTWRRAPLHEAVSELEDGGPVDAVILLLRAGALVDQRDGSGERGATPLLVAVFRGSIEATRVLLAAGADPCVVGEEGDSPLRAAVERSNYQIAQLLLRCGAANTIDDSGGLHSCTALGEAASRLDKAMVELLLKHGAARSARDIDGRTAIERLPARTASNATTWELVHSLLGDPGRP